jgi:RNA 2',3'-cyclic 3'-phosphodiesterase
MTDEVRAFVALELEESLHERLARLAADLRPRLPGLRFASPGSAHLTMRFLGRASPEALDRIAEALAPAAAACPVADVPVTGLGIFPPQGPPRILWLGLDLPAPMLALQTACERAARDAGFEPETRPFRPHLTLGRWRERVARPRLPEIEPAATRLERLVLFRSELKPAGAVHTPLGVFPLGTMGAGGAAILPPSS